MLQYRNESCKFIQILCYKLSLILLLKNQIHLTSKITNFFDYIKAEGSFWTISLRKGGVTLDLSSTF